MENRDFGKFRIYSRALKARKYQVVSGTNHKLHFGPLNTQKPITIHFLERQNPDFPTVWKRQGRDAEKQKLEVIAHTKPPRWNAVWTKFKLQLKLKG